MKVIEGLKLFGAYLESSLSETEITCTGLRGIWRNYDDQFFLKVGKKGLKENPA